jgi:hypothetical protein
MKLEKRKPTGREKDEESVKLLAQLRGKLYSEHIGTARRAAYNLSWMQEDGLDILKEALFSRAARRTKSAAAYGLRKMRGRMEKAALETLSQGLQHYDRNTSRVCENALLVLKNKSPDRLFSKVDVSPSRMRRQPSQRPSSRASSRDTQAGKFEIKQIPQKRKVKNSTQRTNTQKANTQRNNPHK